MMRLSTLWKVDSLIDSAGSSPLAELILAHWPHDPRSLRFFRSSANFLYTFTQESRRYFLRFADGAERSRAAIEAEIELVNWLAAAGVEVAIPVRAGNGQFVTTTETELGTFHAVVFAELPGVQFELDELDDARFHASGAALGKLHTALMGYPGQGRLAAGRGATISTRPENLSLPTLPACSGNGMRFPRRLALCRWMTADWG
ncbi:MAG: phosphotransferase [Anaerolineales bacterium]